MNIKQGSSEAPIEKTNHNEFDCPEIYTKDDEKTNNKNREKDAYNYSEIERITTEQPYELDVFEINLN